MTKKCFAAIKTAQETMEYIETRAKDVLQHPERAFAALSDILAKAEKWNADFGDVDPAWQPPDANEQADTESQTKKFGAFIQE